MALLWGKTVIGPRIVPEDKRLLEEWGVGDGLDETLSVVVAGHPHDVSGALWEEIGRVCGV